MTELQKNNPLPDNAGLKFGQYPMKSQLWSDKMLIPLAVISVHMNKINSERRELLFQQLLQ